MRFSFRNFIDLLFPPTCVRCQREGSWLCALCRNGLPERVVSWCPVCCAEVKEQNHKHLTELGLDAIFSWLPYHVPWVERTVQDIKFGGLSSYAGMLGAELAIRFPASLRVAAQPLSLAAAGSPTRSVMERSQSIITAIPLSKKRERERGFNQAEVLAHALSKSCGIQYERLLQRNKVTKPQARLSAEERFANVANAFSLTKAQSHRISILRGKGTSDTNFAIRGKTCILVDDVVTTGATLSAAASVLRSAGADRVIALTVAYSDIRKELGKGG